MKLPCLGSSGTKAMSRRTTPGSIGRDTFSHSERADSSDLAGCTDPNNGRVVRVRDRAAVSETKCLRLTSEESEEEEEALAILLKRGRDREVRQ